jgi:hypothetical protein
MLPILVYLPKSVTMVLDASLSSVPLKTEFYDRHERRAYERAVEIATYVVNNPGSVASAMSFLERHVRADPHQRAAYDLWRAMLQRDPAEIARAMLEDTERGAELRNSAPVFVVLGGERRSELLR